MLSLRENVAEATKAHAAGTAIRLKHELPITEPVPMSSSVTKTPIRLANNSGTDAPRAISVDPAISGGRSYPTLDRIFVLAIKMLASICLASWKAA